ncbi:hypothetical protein ACWEHT_11985 [Streptomyces sp. NPDC004646]
MPEHSAVEDGEWPAGRGHPEVGAESVERERRASVLLILVALVVVLGAGGTVLALVRGGGVPDTATVPSRAAGIPHGYLGVWEARAEGAGVRRRLTLTQGRVGDRVLSLVEDGSGRHCVFAARLTGQPGRQGPVRVGAATVTSGAPLSSCAPGAPSVLTLLPEGRLKRADTGSAGSLVYSRSRAKP